MAAPDKQHVTAIALVAILAAALICGLSARAMSRSDFPPWIFTADVVPVLLALLWSIVKSLLRGEYGPDIIAALSMAGALLAGEILAGAVVALMYSGGLLLEDVAQGRAQREMTALLCRMARNAQTYRASALVETAQEVIDVAVILKARRALGPDQTALMSTAVATVAEPA